MMTEAEWLASTEPQAMLRLLLALDAKIHLFDRKLRLFALACHEVARQDALGTLHDEEALQAVYAYADDPSCPLPFIHSHWTFALADAERAARYAVEVNYKGAAPSLLRCLFGNPWRPIHPLAVHPHWLTWHDCTILRMAQRIYDSRDFSAMPILADALEEAGCTNEDILRHCRDEVCECVRPWDGQWSSLHPSEMGLYGDAYKCLKKCPACGGSGRLMRPKAHGRGCWVLDLLLGKS